MSTDRVRPTHLLVLEPLPGLDEGWDDGLASIGARLAPMDRAPGTYAGPLARAFPPDHPDFDPASSDLVSATAMLGEYFAGNVVGPFDTGASVAVHGPDDEVLGGIVVSHRDPGGAFEGGPWVTDLFVDPPVQGRGLGRVLIVAAAERLRARGEVRLGLSVHVDNRARTLYERLGFRTRP